MNINVGQVRAQPIAPQGLTRQLVAAGTVTAPAVFIRTLPSHPNVFVAPQRAGDQPAGDQPAGDQPHPLLLWLFKALGVAVAQQLFPDHQALVGGFCLAFDCLGNGRELVESGAFDLDDAVALGKVALDTLTLQSMLVGRAVATGLTQAATGVGFIANLRHAYFAGPIVTSIAPRAVPPEQYIAATLLPLWLILTSDQFHLAVAKAAPPRDHIFVSVL